MTPRIHPSAHAAVAAAAVALGAVIALWVAGPTRLDIPWAPSWDLRLELRLDGLGLLYCLLAAGVGLVVFLYATRYLPTHHAETDSPGTRQPHVYAWLVAFMVSMIGLAVAQDLVLLFVFWDLTAIASYYLIATDETEGDARQAALTAMLVTGVTAVLLLIGAVMLWAEYGTFSLPELFEVAGDGTYVTAATALIVLAGLAKCAQVPFHFWLPRAMIAPTPVSAYLHSAAMVAAGVLLIGRVYPLVERSDVLLDGLIAVGFGSIVVGGILALTRDGLKEVLAYSTVSQYGYVVLIYGCGGKSAPAAAALYVVGHALEKSALFLTAGAVTDATGADKLSQVSGLARRMPGLAAGSAVAAAGLAGLPLTLGFFQDELLFKAALERGDLVAGVAVAGAVLTFAYMARFWGGVFLGAPTEARKDIHAPARALALPVAALGLLVLVGGFVVSPFTALADEAAVASRPGAGPAEAAYHLDARTENLMALAVFALGALLVVTRGLWVRPVAAGVDAVARVGPGRAYTGGLRLLNALSDRMHAVEVRDLRTRVAAVLAPAGLLAAAGLIATPLAGYQTGGVATGDIELLLALIIVSAGALALAPLRAHMSMVLLLSALGYALALVYAFFGAPDVALVAVLVETVLALVVFGVLSLVPRDVMEREASLSDRHAGWRDPLLACIAAVFAFLVTWGALSRPRGETVVGEELYARTPAAHADNSVTAILADFRALDTLGEITVVVIAMIGVARAVYPKTRSS